MEVPYATPPQTPIEPHEGRFSSTVKPISEYRPDPDGRRAVAILGMPDDTGVKMNNGRPGAKEGPSAIRRALARMGVDRPATFEWPIVYDAGDVLPAGDDLDETHRRVSEASASLAKAGLLPIGLGGGHDLTFAFVRGVMDGLPPAERPTMGFYFDAHLDVRETKGSGMPFRGLIEDCDIEELVITGMDVAANTRDHYEWFQSHGGRWDDGFHVDTAIREGPPFFASLDLDAIESASAPGVSAANPVGLGVHAATTWILPLAMSPQLRCLDIMELSPPHDAHGRTARLAARLFLEALQSMAEGSR